MTPMIRPPAGTDPENTVVYTLITRPRRWSGTWSWIVVFAVTAIPTPPAPAITIATSESGKNRDTARSREPAPSASAPTIIPFGDGRGLKATDRADTVEPTPDAAIRKP